MPPYLRSALLVAAALAAVTLGACRSAANLFVEPSPTDPLDGYKGVLAETGNRTEMDWGPKQELLLDKFTALTESKRQLEKRCSELEATNQNLQSQLGDEGKLLAKEKALRAQAEAETEQLRERRRELEARILSLSIEKAKLEQAALHGKIQQLSASLETLNATAVEAAAPPPRSR